MPELYPVMIPHTISGKTVRHLMRVHQKTIRGLATEMQITMKRVRQVRTRGIIETEGPGVVMTWMEYLTGIKPTLAEVDYLRSLIK